MRLERLISQVHPLFEAAQDLYRASFPLHEQRTEDDQIRALEHPAYHCDLVLEDASLLGLALYWEFPQYLYLEHLCTVPAVRGHGHGAEILKRLSQKEKTIILEIDPPEDEISQRRRDFYTRSGFQVNPFPHRHPAYRRDCAPHPLVVLSAPQALSREQFQQFQTDLHDVVMQFSEK